MSTSEKTIRQIIKYTRKKDGKQNRAKYAKIMNKKDKWIWSGTNI